MFILRMYLSLSRRRAALASLPFAVAATISTPVEARGAARDTTSALGERVVIVIRHGLRSPIESPTELLAASGRTFPAWPVASGQLTPLGEAQLAGMAETIGRDVLLMGKDGGCELHGTVWADVRDYRTIRSGDIVARSLGKCSSPSRHAAAGGSDPLFDATRAGACLLPVDAPKPTDEQERRSMIAAAEYLAYAQGLPFQTSGASERDTVFADMPSHEWLVARQFTTLPAAGARTAALTQVIVNFLDGKTAQQSPLPATAQVATIVGHDTDLAGLRAVFGLDWVLPDQPDSTGPATALVLRTSTSGPHGSRRISATIYYQTITDIRAGKAHDARHIDLRFADCRAGASCGWAKIREVALSAIPASCRWPDTIAVPDRRAKAAIGPNRAASY